VNEAELGRYIEQKREDLGLTKAAAARAAGVSRSTWHEIEAGRRLNILAETLHKFDRALGLDHDHLRRKLNPPPEPDGESDDPRWTLVKLVMAMSADDAARWAEAMRRFGWGAP
jgi:transcriptional regulator with XRE-family HTH domain